MYALLIVSSFLSATFAADLGNILAAPVPPLPPSKDPFYTAPYGYENTVPGAVLRVRIAPGLAKAIANCSAAYNILYRTTDSNYKPAWAVTTLLIPQSVSENSTVNSTTISPGSVLLSYQVACKCQFSTTCHN
jgi:hypothetical protein